jgi:hypothetical protein
MMANACRMKLVHEGWLAQEEQAAAGQDIDLIREGWNLLE